MYVVKCDFNDTSGQTKWIKPNTEASVSFTELKQIIPNRISRYLNLQILKLKLNF